MAPRLHAHSKAPSHQFLDVPFANPHLHSAFSVPFRLTSSKSPPRSTRALLQRQRLQDEAEQHATASGVHLLHPNSTSTVLVNKAIPGLKTSAAFFASLRTNLSLHASPPLASPASTPNSLHPITDPYFPPPSPLATPSDLAPIMDPVDTAAASATSQLQADLTASTTAAPQSANSKTSTAAATDGDLLAGVPELHTFTATSRAERVDALKLVADSVAQQRQVANRALLFHPLHLSITVAVLAMLVRMLHNAGTDAIPIAFTCGGVLTTLMLVCRFVTKDYLFAAERINFDWLGGDGDDAAQTIVTRYGDEIIGTAIVTWRAQSSGSGSGKQRRKSWSGAVRAWTVRLRYRGKGVGSALLEEVVKEARKKGADSVEFDDAHANSVRVLPDFYNGVFDRREQTARVLLQDLLDSNTGRGKRK